MPERAIAAKLEADETVTGLVGDRMYVALLPQESDLPAIVYRRTSEEEVGSLAGSSALAMAAIEVNALAEEFAQARALAKAIRDALRYASGELGGVVVQTIVPAPDDADELLPLPGAEEGVHRIVKNYVVWYEED